MSSSLNLMQHSFSPSNSPPIIPYNFSSSRTFSIPFSTKNLKYSPGFPRISWDSRRRNRIQAKNPERDTQFSQENGGSKSNPSTSFLSILCPLLKLFSGGDPSQERNYVLEEATSSLSSFARLPWGSRSLSSSLDNRAISRVVDPPMRLQLFEFACPFCRRVREAMTELDISAEIYPCPKGSVRHREMVRTLGGKEQFPFLVDPNTGISMYESSGIVKYLFQPYGEGKSPSLGLLESTVLTGWVPTLLRAGRGMTLWEKATKEPPANKLQLFSYENSPHARVVREVLCELELPYILQNVGEGSLRTNLLLKASGSKEVPYIIDPNTGAQIGDYRKILWRRRIKHQSYIKIWNRFYGEEE